MFYCFHFIFNINFSIAVSNHSCITGTVEGTAVIGIQTTTASTG